MAKVLTTLRTHWKKSLFFTLAGGYGVHWASIKYEDQNTMKRLCRQALKYGEVSQPLSTPSYRVTVILNPAASKGSARKKFEKYCAPILHLAGLKVSIIRTEAEGQAKEIMEIMADADAVLVAGGDGTIMEAVTGLLRRQDGNELRRSLPLGVLPVGTNNRLAKNLFPDVSTRRSDVELMASAAMACVEQVYRSLDVVRVKNISEDSEFAGKQLYGLTEVQFGAFRDAHERMSKYWYFAGLKKVMTYVFAYTSSAKDILWDCASQINLGYPADIRADKKPATEEKINQQNSSWWSFFFPSKNLPKEEKQENGQAEIEIDWTQWVDYRGPEIRIRSPNSKPLSTKALSGALDISIAPQEISFTEFVKEGWRREKQLLKKDVTETGGDNPSWTSKSAPAVQVLSNSSSEKSFSIDNEEVEVNGSIELQLLKDYVVMFCSQQAKYMGPVTDIGAKVSSVSEASKKWWQQASSRRTFASNVQGVSNLKM